MPRVMNGHKKPELGEEYALMAHLLEEFRKAWMEEFKKSNTDAMKFTRLSVVALTQLSAVLGVDAGMTAEQFSAVCNAQYAEVYKNAPKFS